MDGIVLGKMTPDAFFAWQVAQDALYELVGGRPVPLRTMGPGTTVQHDCVSVNVLVALHGRLRGSNLRSSTKAVAVQIDPETLRRPDVTVAVAAILPDAYAVREAILVVEVASPSATAVERTRKLEDYKRHPTLVYILLLETLKPQALLYRRDQDGWAIETFEGLDAIIDLPAIGTHLALADVYDRLTFAPRRNL